MIEAAAEAAAEAEAAEAVGEVAAVTIVHPVKCTRSLVPNVVWKPKFPSSLMVHDLSIAGIATRNAGLHGTDF